jgi:thioredoxin reductase (NADPH)
MMAPIFKKVAGQFKDKAVFVKVDTNAQYELSSRYQIRSLPTFQFFVAGQKADQAVGGIGEQGLIQSTQKVVRQAEMENVVLTLDNLQAYYADVDSSKDLSDVQNVLKKCADMTKKFNPDKQCVGAAANQLGRRLRQKYKKAPKMVPRYDATAADGNEEAKPEQTEKTKPEKKATGSSSKPNLHLASKEELMAELERRLDEERDNQVEEEDADEDEPDPDFHKWTPGPFPERVVVVGGGPAGLAAALYAARAGLAPLVIAPSMGGQLQGKGVDVENYPGLSNQTGPALVAAMRQQAAHYGAMFEDDLVTAVDASQRPYKVMANSSGLISTHTIIVATGADANWLNIPGEWELRGGGVSSCATCDGFLYSGKHTVVVGGGDGAMEEALVLARTSRKVTVIHRRDSFRASKVLADRVLSHPSIAVVWNTTVVKVIGETPDTPSDENVDLDSLQPVVSAVRVRDVNTGDEREIACDAMFVSIGHTPNTGFLKGVVEFNPDHSGYVQTYGGSTQTSAPGIFAAGDVADSVYRQAITSAGSGAAAALDAERYLSEHGLGNEAADLEAELMAELMSDGSASSSASYNVYEEAGGRAAGIKESL